MEKKNIKGTLSENIIQQIKEHNITQMQLADKISDLEKEKKVSRKISQQSISRYLKGETFPDEDTEEIIEKALYSIPSSSLSVKKIKYQKEIEEKEKQRDMKLEEEYGSNSPNGKFSEYAVSLLFGDNSEERTNLLNLLPDEEDFEETELIDRFQLLEYWRNTPKKIQDFWLEMLSVLEKFSNFMEEVFYELLQTTISFNSFFDVLNEYQDKCYINYLYDKNIDKLTHDDLCFLGKIMIAAGKADENRAYIKKLLEQMDKAKLKSDEDEAEVKEGVYICRSIFCNKWLHRSYSMSNHSTLPQDDRERYFLKVYDNVSRKDSCRGLYDYENFMNCAARMVYMEKYGWFGLYEAYLFEKTQKNKPKNAKMREDLFLTEDEKNFILMIKERMGNEKQA